MYSVRSARLRLHALRDSFDFHARGAADHDCVSFAIAKQVRVRLLQLVSWRVDPRLPFRAVTRVHGDKSSVPACAGLRFADGGSVTFASGMVQQQCVGLELECIRRALGGARSPSREPQFPSHRGETRCTRQPSYGLDKLPKTFQVALGTSWSLLFLQMTSLHFTGHMSLIKVNLILGGEMCCAFISVEVNDNSTRGSHYTPTPVYLFILPHAYNQLASMLSEQLQVPKSKAYTTRVSASLIGAVILGHATKPKLAVLLDNLTGTFIKKRITGSTVIKRNTQRCTADKLPMLSPMTERAYSALSNEVAPSARTTSAVFLARRHAPPPCSAEILISLQIGDLKDP
ncbi:hypothetical protein FIBSPDRAFT_931124 [Athelia psychrophila]|uniref:Uncharacterized protein n=1 Tax=Athelia psychrophila TaxID=1759441 RepID=A0A166KW20_9AGAM|nr:hypothetical protein FIBSPDRAFT_931124 [Fibularhizoctonia sp. CBS 109695]